jgi:hypothetical protein
VVAAGVQEVRLPVEMHPVVLLPAQAVQLSARQLVAVQQLLLQAPASALQAETGAAAVLLLAHSDFSPATPEAAVSCCKLPAVAGVAPVAGSRAGKMDPFTQHACVGSARQVAP